MGERRPTDHRKAYVRIADDLRHEIATGGYQVGDTLPPGGELAQRYNVAGMTINNAIAVLRDEGLVQTRQGSRGATVIALPAEGATEAPPERSDEFQLLYAQIQELRSSIRHLGSRLDELDERTRGS